MSVALDLFNDTNGTALSSHTMDTGTGWVEQQGTWQIQSNSAKLITSAGDDQCTTYTTTTLSDVDITVDILTPGSGGTDSGILFNYVDDSNYWIFFASNFYGGFILQERSGGTFTSRGLYSGLGSPAASTVYTLRIITMGDIVNCYVNGTLVNTYRMTSRPHKTAVKHGLRCYENGRGTLYQSFTLNQVLFDPIFAALSIFYATVVTDMVNLGTIYQAGDYTVPAANDTEPVRSFKCPYTGKGWVASNSNPAIVPSLVDLGGTPKQWGIRISNTGGSSNFRADTTNDFDAGNQCMIYLAAIPDDADMLGLFDGAPYQPNVIRNFGAHQWEWWSGDPTFDLGSFTPGGLNLFTFSHDITTQREVDYYLNGVFQNTYTDPNTTSTAWSRPVFGNINEDGTNKFKGIFVGCSVFRADHNSTTRAIVENHLAPTSGTTYNLSNSDTLTFSESMTVQSSAPIFRSISDTLIFSDIMRNTNILVSFGDTLTFTDTMVKSKITSQTMDDTITFSEIMRPVIVGVFSDVLDFTDSMTFELIKNRVWADTLNLVEVYGLNKTLGKTIADTLVFTESMTAKKAVNLASSDTLVFTEKYYGRGFDISFGDTLVFSDTFVKSAIRSRTINDTLAFNDAQGYAVRYSLQKFAEDALEFKENLYVYKVRTGIFLKGLTGAICLPSPEFNDFQANQSKIVLHRAMSGDYRSYVKNTERDRLNWRFLLTKTQKDNLEYFVEQEINNTIIVNDWEGRQWAFQLVNDAFDFTEVSRWERIGNKFEVTLEFEGVRYYG